MTGPVRRFLAVPIPTGAFVGAALVDGAHLAPTDSWSGACVLAGLLLIGYGLRLARQERHT